MNVELKQLTKRYGRVCALDRVALTLPPGRVVAVIGLNGAGKTTLLRCLAGIVAPTAGQVLYDGREFHRRDLAVRRRLMFLPDFPALFAHLSALQHIALVLRAYERDAPEVEDRIVAALRDFDVLPLAEHPVGTLSRGQLYKVAFTALLAVAPELWLLDEPFASGLDPQGLSILKQRSREAAAAGATIVYSTQILEIAARFCDLLCVIDRGALRETFTRDQLAVLPAEGPDSLEMRLRQFREPAA